MSNERKSIISSPPLLSQLTGKVERVTFHNEENGYCVLQIQSSDQKEPITLVGTASLVTPGESVEAIGKFIQHKNFGLQFEAESIRLFAPKDPVEIEKYLGSGRFEGVGPQIARKLMKAFKNEVLTVLDETPERLKEIPGLGRQRIEKMTVAWKEQRFIRELVFFLQQHRLTTNRAVQIFKRFGKDSISLIRENPYRLSEEISGIGFKSADGLAGSLGFDLASTLRARAGIVHILNESSLQGHLAYSESKTLKEAAALLHLEPSQLEAVIESLIETRQIVRDDIEGTRSLYLARYFLLETEVAKLLMQLKKGPLPWSSTSSVERGSFFKNNLNLELAPLQKKAIEGALTHKVFVITGGPGTGKTTLTRGIVSLVRAQDPRLRIQLGSPTGRGSKRLSECTGLDARTIHRILGYQGKHLRFSFHERNPLPVDLMLIDEVSMIDLELMGDLLRALPPHAALILIGDQDQLPSIGPGSLLKSILESGTVASVELTEIFRQDKESKIIRAAHEIKRGEMPTFTKSEGLTDFYFLETEETESIFNKILELVTERIPKAFSLDPYQDIQVLCPMHQGPLGAKAFNRALQTILNPQPSTLKLERHGNLFSLHDKVMVITNDYDKEVFNGDTGRIESLNSTEQKLRVHFDQREVSFDRNELDRLTLAYACTIHKAQGSEYPAVVIPLSTQNQIMLKRNLIYTGMTRGKVLVIFVGQKRALRLAIASERQALRGSKLSERLKQADL